MLDSTGAVLQHPEDPVHHRYRHSDAMICRYFKVAHRDMVYLKFILEGYEGMNVMSTVDNRVGIIRIAIMPGFVEDMDRLLAELGRQMTMEPVSWQDERCDF